MSERIKLVELVGKTIREIYIDIGGYIVIQCSDDYCLAVKADELFDEEGNRFNLDEIKHRVA